MKIVFTLLLAVLLAGCTTAQGLTLEEAGGQIEELEAQVSDLEDELDQYKQALEEANNKLADAQWYAWDDYYTMGEVLENLDPVDEP